MKQIDFLPSRYRDISAIRDAKIWRCSSTILVGSVIILASAFQMTWKRELQKQLAFLEPQYQSAVELIAKHSRLQAEYSESQHDAALYAYLEHPWPRTQLLSGIIAPLQPNITLDELRILQEEKPAPPASSTGIPPPPTTPPTDDPNEPAAGKDLKRLRIENDSKQTVIYLSGLTTDTAALHQYVVGLGQLPLFVKTELRSLESIKDAKKINLDASRFHVRILVRPGYGQPNGPTEPLQRIQKLEVEESKPGSETVLNSSELPKTENRVVADLSTATPTQVIP